MSRGYYGEFDDDLVNDDDNHDDLNAEHNNPSPFGPAMVQGSGQTFPTRFTPRNDYLHPMELFGGRLSVRDVVRYVDVLPGHRVRHACKADQRCDFSDAPCPMIAPHSS